LSHHSAPKGIRGGSGELDAELAGRFFYKAPKPWVRSAMHCDLHTAISIPVTPLEMAVDYSADDEICCLGCQTPLELHLPDQNRPERLLGTCNACGSWYLLDCEASAIVLLPQSQSLLVPAA
jgi:hypothetical protein